MSGIPIKVTEPVIPVTLPVSGKDVTYRAFKVKEEKILLMAAESEDQKSLMQAFKQVIENCISNPTINVGGLPIYDLELLFVLIRVAAVNNVATFQIRDRDDGQTYTINIDLQELLSKREIKLPEKKIQLTDEVGVIMGDMTFDIFTKTMGTGQTDTEVSIMTLARLIDKIYDSEQAIDTVDFTDEEVLDFLEELPSSAMSKLNEYVGGIPRLVLDTSYTTALGEVKPFRLEGLNDFFQFV